MYNDILPFVGKSPRALQMAACLLPFFTPYIAYFVFNILIDA